jgi:hypothetical protein
MNKAYPKYKSSGVEWLGDVPEHWEIKPLFALTYENKVKNTGLKEYRTALISSAVTGKIDVREAV